jgi:hypothetical protein
VQIESNQSEAPAIPGLDSPPGHRLSTDLRRALNIRGPRCDTWQMSCKTAAASGALFHPPNRVNMFITGCDCRPVYSIGRWLCAAVRRASIPALCIGKRQLLDRPDPEQLVDVARHCWSSTSTRALFPLSSKSPIFVLGAECIAPELTTR